MGDARIVDELGEGQMRRVADAAREKGVTPGQLLSELLCRLEELEAVDGV